MDDESGSPAEEGAMVSPNNKVLQHYLHGTYANLFKLMMWWVALPAVTAALVPDYGAAVGVGRIVFSVALVIFSPIGGIIAGRVAPKTILIRAAVTRFAVWCVLLPLVWFFSDTQWFSQNQTVVFVVLNIGLFAEGVAVALSVVLDIDNCGLDIVGKWYSLNINDNLRNYFNTRNEIFQAFCLVILNPGLAFMTYFIKTRLHGSSEVTKDTLSSGILVALFFVTFFGATAAQIWHFGLLPRSSRSHNDEASLLINAVAQDENSNGAEEDEEGESEKLSKQVAAIPHELWEALKIVVHHRPIMWRLIFLGLEIALEDASIVVVAGQIGKDFSWFGNGDPVSGFKWSAVIVATGKAGAALASFAMMKRFQPPKNVRGYWFLFVFIFVAGCCMAFIPAIEYWSRHGLSVNAARSLVALTYFLFFFFSTLPKLGLMCLLQSMAAQITDGHRIFGFIGVIVTVFDGAITLGLSIVFTQYPLAKALWISASFFMIHGVLELVFGPTLILAPLKQDEQDGSDRASSPVQSVSSAEMPSVDS